MCAQLRAQAGSPGAEGDRLTLLLAAGKVARGGVDRLVKSRRKKFADLQELAVTGRARRWAARSRTCRRRTGRGCGPPICRPPS